MIFKKKRNNGIKINKYLNNLILKLKDYKNIWIIN